jgi:hypothetical protein
MLKTTAASPATRTERGILKIAPVCFKLKRSAGTLQECFDRALGFVVQQISPLFLFLYRISLQAMSHYGFCHTQGRKSDKTIADVSVQDFACGLKKQPCYCAVPLILPHFGMNRN